MIQLKYFGMLAEIIGNMEEEVPRDATNVKELRSWLEQKYPSVKNVNYQVAINHTLVDADAEFKSGDEVAFLPPFSGG